MNEPAQLLLYRFGAGSAFEGHLVGALERMEAGGALRTLDVLVVTADADSGEISAVELGGRSATGLVGPLVGFRLEPAERARATRRALADTGARGELIRRLAATLGRGETVVALLVAHTWAKALDEAVHRTSGTTLTNVMVEPRSLHELAPEILAAVEAPE
jgi:hypothetical protein